MNLRDGGIPTHSTRQLAGLSEEERRRAVMSTDRADHDSLPIYMLGVFGMV